MDRAAFTPSDSHTVLARSRHADRLAEATWQRRLDQLGGGGRTRRLGGRLAAALESAAAVAIRAWPDSRDGLRSAEQALAARGVTWASDPAHDHELAHELRAARQRRAQRAPGSERVAVPIVADPAPRPVNGAEPDRALAA